MLSVNGHFYSGSCFSAIKGNFPICSGANLLKISKVNGSPKCHVDNYFVKHIYIMDFLETIVYLNCPIIQFRVTQKL